MSFSNSLRFSLWHDPFLRAAGRLLHGAPAALERKDPSWDRGWCPPRCAWATYAIRRGCSHWSPSYRTLILLPKYIFRHLILDWRLELLTLRSSPPISINSINPIMKMNPWHNNMNIIFYFKSLIQYPMWPNSMQFKTESGIKIWFDLILTDSKVTDWVIPLLFNKFQMLWIIPLDEPSNIN